MMPVETQHSIAIWGHQTFGASTPREVYDWAADEMRELLAELDDDPNCEREATREEVADVALLLLRLAAVSGFNLLAAVDRKMAINRRRKWEKQADGSWVKVEQASK
jgi:NTP pyrophosphatase (non-canonical NTP hydrolase)